MAALLGAEKEALSLLSCEAPAEVILDRITRSIETLVPGTLASLLRVDRSEGTLGRMVAPSLPAELKSRCESLPIGPSVGSCGTAAFYKAPVIVADIETDPLWEEYRGLAGQFGLRACWSTPVMDRSGDVLGTFAMYHTERHVPSADEVDVVDRACHIASIAMARERVAAPWAGHGLEWVEGLKQSLLAQISHELRTPLTSVLGFAATLERDEVWADPSLVRELAGRLIANANQLERLVTTSLEPLLAAALSSAAVPRVRSERRDAAPTEPTDALDACLMAGKYLLNVLRWADIDPADISSQSEALDRVWPVDWAYDAWCAWHACQVAIRREAESSDPTVRRYDPDLISLDRRRSWRTSGRVAKMDQSVPNEQQPIRHARRDEPPAEPGPPTSP